MTWSTIYTSLSPQFGFLHPYWAVEILHQIIYNSVQTHSVPNSMKQWWKPFITFFSGKHIIDFFRYRELSWYKLNVKAPQKRHRMVTRPQGQGRFPRRSVEVKMWQNFIKKKVRNICWYASIPVVSHKVLFPISAFHHYILSEVWLLNFL